MSFGIHNKWWGSLLCKRSMLDNAFAAIKGLFSRNRPSCSGLPAGRLEFWGGLIGAVAILAAVCSIMILAVVSMRLKYPLDSIALFAELAVFAYFAHLVCMLFVRRIHDAGLPRCIAILPIAACVCVALVLWTDRVPNRASWIFENVSWLAFVSSAVVIGLLPGKRSDAPRRKTFFKAVLVVLAILLPSAFALSVLVWC